MASIGYRSAWIDIERNIFPGKNLPKGTFFHLFMNLSVLMFALIMVCFGVEFIKWQINKVIIGDARVVMHTKNSNELTIQLIYCYNQGGTYSIQIGEEGICDNRLTEENNVTQLYPFSQGRIYREPIGWQHSKNEFILRYTLNSHPIKKQLVPVSGNHQSLSTYGFFNNNQKKEIEHNVIIIPLNVIGLINWEEQTALVPKGLDKIRKQYVLLQEMHTALMSSSNSPNSFEDLLDAIQSQRLKHFLDSNPAFEKAYNSWVFFLQKSGDEKTGLFFCEDYSNSKCNKFFWVRVLWVENIFLASRRIEEPFYGLVDLELAVNSRSFEEHKATINSFKKKQLDIQLIDSNYDQQAILLNKNDIKDLKQCFTVDGISPKVFSVSEEYSTFKSPLLYPAWIKSCLSDEFNQENKLYNKGIQSSESVLNKGGVLEVIDVYFDSYSDIKQQLLLEYERNSSRKNIVLRTTPAEKSKVNKIRLLEENMDLVGGVVLIGVALIQFYALYMNLQTIRIQEQPLFGLLQTYAFHKKDIAFYHFMRVLFTWSLAIIVVVGFVSFLVASFWLFCNSTFHSFFLELHHSYWPIVGVISPFLIIILLLIIEVLKMYWILNKEPIENIKR